MAAKIPHLMTLADLSVGQLNRALTHSAALKRISKPLLEPYTGATRSLPAVEQTLANKTVALLFSKRSTRTRVAAETSAVLLGGRALFLGREDIQLGVNESARDTVNVLGGMCQGIFARVGEHDEVEVSLLWIVFCGLHAGLQAMLGTGCIFPCSSSKCVIFAMASYSNTCGRAHSS